MPKCEAIFPMVFFLLSEFVGGAEKKGDTQSTEKNPSSTEAMTGKKKKKTCQGFKWRRSQQTFKPRHESESAKIVDSLFLLALHRCLPLTVKGIAQGKQCTQRVIRKLQ